MWPPPPGRRLAGVPIGLVVCWQSVVLLAAVGTTLPAGQMVGLGLIAAVLIGGTGLRLRGRWAHEWTALWLGYHLRSARRQPDRQPPELALLDRTVARLTIGRAEADGREVALLCQAGVVTAVLELTPPPQPTALVDLPMALALPADPSMPATSVQLLSHAGPAPRAWLAVQVRREPGDTNQELRQTLGNVVRRVRRRLPEQLRAEPLDRPALAAALRSLTQLDLAAARRPPAAPATAGQGAAAPGREGWRAWWAGSVPQTTLVIRGWPGLPGPPDEAVLRVLRQQATPHTVSVAARRLQLTHAHGPYRAGEEVLTLELAVRLAEPDPATLDLTAERLCRQLHGAGAVVARLDGEQLPGLAATLPLGGFCYRYRPVPLPRTAARPTPAASPVPPLPAPPVPAPPAPSVPAPSVPAPPALARGRAQVPNRRPAGGPAAPGPPAGETERLVALARTTHSATQVISVVAATSGVGASTTAAVLARTLAAVRDDYTALLAGSARQGAIATVRQTYDDHAFVIVDVGCHLDEIGAHALRLSDRVVVVTNSDRRTVGATQRALDHIHRINPTLAAAAVIVVGGRNSREYDRVRQELAQDHRPQAAQIVPVPYDSALRAIGCPAPAELQALTREGYLRLAALLAGPRTTAAATVVPANY